MTYPDDLIATSQDVRPFPPTPPETPCAFRQSPRRVPTAAIVVGILMLFFALCALILTVLNVVFLLHTDAPYSNYIGVWIFTLVVNVLAVILQSTMGIGLCTLARWARKGAIITIISLFVLYAFAFATTFTVLFVTPSNTDSSSVMSFIEMFVVTTVFTVITLANTFTNAAMAYSLTRPHVVDVFEHQISSRA